MHPFITSYVAGLNRSDAGHSSVRVVWRVVSSEHAEFVVSATQCPLVDELADQPLPADGTRRQQRAVVHHQSVLSGDTVQHSLKQP